MDSVTAYDRSGGDQHQICTEWCTQSRRNPTLLQTESRQVSSNQRHMHPALAAVVQKHLSCEFRKPVAAHNLAAFERLMAQVTANPRALVLDSFCGTGHSTALLAQRHPDHLVVGIDKSAQRLGKHPTGAGHNYILLQADCEDIWQLLAAQGLTADYHYLLYPNPWPKAKHLQRRVHGHASFAWLLQLAGRTGQMQPATKYASMGGIHRGEIELRSNWQVYVEEFGTAMHLAGCHGRIARVPAGPDLTLFETKYRQSGHELWAFTSNAPP